MKAEPIEETGGGGVDDVRVQADGLDIVGPVCADSYRAELLIDCCGDEIKLQ